MRPPAAAAAAQPRSYKPGPLRLDAEGREVDEHGVPIMRKQAVTELKVSTSHRGFSVATLVDREVSVSAL